jgi:RNA 3'-terminal phosphate cyclase (ATP)
VLKLSGADGGGQIIRTAVALSALTGKAFSMSHIRGSRPEPGLKAQHVAAVQAVAQICDAKVTGLTTGSEIIRFEPGSVGGGDLQAEVGTAGSIALVFDAVLPVAYVLDTPLTLTVTGGTDVRWAPTMTHHATVKRRIVSCFGLRYQSETTRVGFYPAGGGKATVKLPSGTPSAAVLTDRGPLESGIIYATATPDLEQASVAERMVAPVIEAYPDVDCRVRYRAADSAGAVCCLAATFKNSIAGFDTVGRPGRSAEAVGTDVLQAFEAFCQTDAAIDEYTADQVMIPLAVAGGTVTIDRVTSHITSNAGVIRRFGGDLRIETDTKAIRMQSAGGLKTR